MSEITAYMVFSVFASTLGPFQYGFHLAELNAPQDMIICSKKKVAGRIVLSNAFEFMDCIQMTEMQFAFLSSVFVLGGLIAALSAGPGSASYGRLKAMQLSSLLFAIGSLLETLSNSIITISIGRFLAGLGAGVTTVVTPLYISEIAPPNMGGLFGTMTQLMICLGILTTQTLGYIVSKSGQWRIILGFGAGLGLVNTIILLFIPESPSWLAANNKAQLAKKILKRIRGPKCSIQKEVASWNIQENAYTEEDPLLRSPMTSSAMQSRPHGSRISSTYKASNPTKSIFGLMSDPFYRPTVIIVVGIMLSQQFCGINSINLYSVSLLRGVLPISSLLITVLISSMNVITTILFAPLPDMIGRKKCLIISAMGMGTMSTFLAISLVIKAQLPSAIFVVLFVVFFAVGLGPVPFTMASELVDRDQVSAMQSLCLAGNYIGTYIVAQFFPLVNSWLNAKLGGMGWVYFVFAVLSGMCTLFFVYGVPDTKRGQKLDNTAGQPIEDPLRD